MRWISWTTAVGCVVIVAAACGGSAKNAGFGNVPDGGTSSGSSGGTSGGSSGSFGDDSDAHFGMGDDGPAGCSETCSADLHSVIDCNGNVKATCSSDQGCSAGSCVAACAAADANKSTFGCEYYSVDPDVIDAVGVGAGPPQGGCFALYIANTWDSPVNITADWGGQTVDVSKSAYVPSGSGPSLTYQPLGGTSLAQGQVAILFASQAPNEGSTPPIDFSCPAGITPAFAQDIAIHGSGLGKAFHVTTDRPVVAYDIFPYGGGQSAATSATLLVPTSAWDVNYIAVDAYQADTTVPTAYPFVEIVASQANTTVTISPTSAIVGGTGVAAAAAGTPTKYTLTAPGDYVQFTQSTQQELIGSPILSDKPVGVWGGATCLNIAPSVCCCDSSHQELFPVKTLGQEYVATRYRDRYQGEVESTPWRIVGAVAGTTLTYDPATPTGAPTTLNVGQVVTFSTIAPFTVKSQDAMHPFYMSAHMTGAETLQGGNGVRGDPEFVNIIPPAEWLPSYVFFTDPTYSETNLVLVRPKGGADVNLDCASGPITGWLPVGSGAYEYALFDLSTGNFQGANGCNNGRHEITSATPFGLTVWGWGSEATGAIYTEYVSYAYPAGASVQPINTVVVNPVGAQ